MASGRVSANSAVSSSASSCFAAAGALDGARGQLGADRAVVAPARALARDEAPERGLDHVKDALLHPLGVHVLRVHAQPLGQRVATRLQVLAHPVRRRERVLGRDVVAVGRQPAQVGGPLLHQRQPPLGQVGRDLHAHVGHQLQRRPHQRAHLVQRHVLAPRRHRRGVAGGLGALGLVGYLRGLGAVVARVGHEVLQDHLLEVAVLGVHRRQRLQRLDPLGRRLADAHQDPRREGDLQLTGIADGLQPALGVLGRRALVHHQVRVHRLQHQPLGGGDLAQPRKVGLRQHAQVGVREHPPLQRALARPGHVRGEVVVAVGLQPPRHLGVDLGLLAGEHQQLLGVALDRLVQQPLDLIRVVQVRLVGGERAVLAVALAGA